MNFLLIYTIDPDINELPNAAYIPVDGLELSLMQYNRLKNVQLVGDVIASVFSKSSDRKIYDLFKKNNASISRINARDNLDKIARIAFEQEAENIVLISNANPLIDIDLIDSMIEFLIQSDENYDYVSNMHPESFPAGNCVEIVSTHSLMDASRYARYDYEKKYVTPFFWDNPENWKIGSYQNHKDLSKKYRYCLEYPQDLEVVKMIYNELFKGRIDVSYEEIVSFLDENPEINQINEKYKGTHWYRFHFNDLKTITNNDTRLIL